MCSCSISNSFLHSHRPVCVWMSLLVDRNPQFEWTKISSIGLSIHVHASVTKQVNQRRQRLTHPGGVLTYGFAFYQSGRVYLFHPTKVGFATNPICELNFTATQRRQVLCHVNLVQKRNSDPSIFRLSAHLSCGHFSCVCEYHWAVFDEFTLVDGKWKNVDHEQEVYKRLSCELLRERENPKMTVNSEQRLHMCKRVRNKQAKTAHR